MSFSKHTANQVAHWTQEQRDALELRLVSIEQRLTALESGS
ncbi:hypothetical protein ACFFJQ_07000 [Bacillus capparidis]|uniref:Uncharacterized protein n=1 Tax=Bacillus capparidis TaxID=1840411 RepID=A0ABS4D1N9_9BACI|nr:hypothetical protein [Bacillus capparidis]MBP1083515.1 hypothetical protein [Bacillus capparidis]MED1094713.1 hypothetical protein [Bacillus capparidis]